MAKHHTTTKPAGDRSRRHFDAAFKQEAVNLGKHTNTGQAPRFKVRPRVPRRTVLRRHSHEMHAH